MNQSTRVYLHSIETAVPRYEYDQEFTKTYMQDLYPGDKKTQRLISRIYDGSAIERRYSVVGDFGRTPAEHELFPRNESLRPEPTTKQRNDVYAREARELSWEATRALLSHRESLKGEITHLITVSCTGFSAPGFDLHLARNLDTNGVHRFHIGYMGCYAAFPALKLARHICLSEPDAKVLVVALELCSLHFQLKADPEILVANAIFSDGAASALISADEGDSDGEGLLLNGLWSDQIWDTESEMAWSIGDTGFDMRLSLYVPSIIEENIAPSLERLLAAADLSKGDIDGWAIHPGGRAILDKVAGALGITADDVSVSYDILRDYGNMSSATILFVLKRLLESQTSRSIFAAAFGPGLTIETAHLSRP